MNILKRKVEKNALSLFIKHKQSFNRCLGHSNSKGQIDLDIQPPLDSKNKKK